jgi:hypothetical protein
MSRSDKKNEYISGNVTCLKIFAKRMKMGFYYKGKLRVIITHKTNTSKIRCIIRVK